MKTLHFYSVQNDEGTKLLINYVKLICKRHRLQLIEAKPNANRGDSLKSQKNADVILWDCSIEPGHVYNAFNEWVKHTKKNVIVSRTPLPRNVMTYNQFAPIHGKNFNNEQIAEWLEMALPAVINRDRINTKAGNNIKSGIAEHYWMFDNPADIFLSFRGAEENSAKDWSQRYSKKSSHTIRMVPEAEYSYKTECLTRQQMWEGVNRLFYEMKATKKVAIFLSEDYFDSFWTCSELLSLIKYRYNPSNNGIKQTYLVQKQNTFELLPLYIKSPHFPIKPLTSAQSHRLYKILNNSDPLTIAPETRIPARGLTKLLAFFLRPTMGYYDKEFTGNSFWKVIQVPCPHCAPKKRKAEQVDWNKHLNLDNEKTIIDEFGYFPSTEKKLRTGSIQCPNCLRQVRIENKRLPRTIWIPIQTTEKNQNRPVIEEQSVWEVVNQ